FERFHRGPAAGSPRPGRGIGLTIARSLARAHGGDVVLVTGQGVGATFRLTLPVEESVDVAGARQRRGA
ncbi:MAG: ATP-binding protein, partial [Acidobacteriota bacterium]